MGLVIIPQSRGLVTLENQVDDTSRVGGAAVTAGLIYRNTGVENVVALAQADSAENASGLVGVGTSAGLISLEMATSIKMDEAVQPGVPVWLSAGTAGKGHHSPALGMLPIWTATVDTSVGSDYSCTVVPYRGAMGPNNLRDYLIEETCRDLNCLPWALDVHFRDFSTGKSVVDTTQTDTDGWIYGNITPLSPSIVTISAGSVNMGFYRASATNHPALTGLCDVAWRLSARMSSNGTKNTYLGVQDAATKILYLGCFGDDSDGYWSLGTGTGDVAAASPAVPSVIANVTARDANLIQLDLEGDGLGKYRYRVGGESVAWSAWTAYAGAVSSTLFGMGVAGAGASSTCDWFFYANKVR